MSNPQQNRQLQGAYLQQQKRLEAERRRQMQTARYPRIPTYNETVDYSKGQPNEWKIKAIVRKYEQAGWYLVSRTEDWGFLGLGISGHTFLKFQQ